MKEILPFTFADAVFTGTQGSYHYDVGTAYRIQIIFGDDRVYVACAGHPTCQYRTLMAMHKNWKIQTGRLQDITDYGKIKDTNEEANTNG